MEDLAYTLPDFKTYITSEHAIEDKLRGLCGAISHPVYGKPDHVYCTVVPARCICDEETDLTVCWSDQVKTTIRCHFPRDDMMVMLIAFPDTFVDIIKRGWE